MFERGYLKVGRIRGIPLRIHWTMPFGALLFSGFTFAPAFWVGFFVVVLVHELGHAALVRRYRQQVLSVDITGFGGLTRWSGNTTRTQRSVIAWGGVLAQLALLALAFGVAAVAGPPRSIVTAQLLSVFTMTNLWIIGLNLLPFPPLDGAEAWPLLGDVLRSWRTRGPGRARAAVHGSRVGRAAAGGRRTAVPALGVPRPAADVRGEGAGEHQSRRQSAAHRPAGW